MGMSFRRGGRGFQNVGIDAKVCTSIGAPGTGVDLYETSNGDAKFLIGTAIILALAAIVWLAG